MRCNNTNSIEVSIYENNTDLVIISRLDNLGKGASGLIISMKPLFRNKILGKNHKLICHSIIQK